MSDTTQDALVRNAINLAVMAERQRCVEVAERFADEKDVLALGVTQDILVAAYREGERTANQIAAAIRNRE